MIIPPFPAHFVGQISVIFFPEMLLYPRHKAMIDGAVSQF